MGSQQGDDLQLNGDLACENAEIRSRLTVGGVPITPGASGTKAIIVYRPGAATSAPFYQTWAEVETQVNAVDGAAQLWIDQTGIVGYAQVPATANLDGKGRLEIIGKGPNGEAGLTFADGAQIKNVQTFRTVVLRGQSNTQPPLVWDLDGMICECFDATFLFVGACTQPVMAIVAPVTYISFFFTHSSELRNSNNAGAPVLDVGAGVLCFFCVDALFFPSSFNTTISGPVGSTLQIQTDSSVPPAIVLPGFFGALTQTNIDTFPVPPTHDSSITGDGTTTPLAVAPAGVNAPTTIVGIARPTVQTVLFEDFISSGNVYFQTSALPANAGLTSDGAIPATIGTAFLFINANGQFAALSNEVGVTESGQGSPVASGGNPNLRIDNYDRVIWQCRAKLQAAPTALSDFDVRIGCAVSVSTGNGIGFRAGVADMGNANWWCRNPGSADVDTGVAVDNAVHTFTFIRTPVSCLYYIDGVLVATIASVATGSDYLAWNAVISGEPTTPAPTILWVDWMYFAAELAR